MREALSPHCSATFRFYAELNDFLPPRQQQRTVIYQFSLPASVKDVIESLGVPHTEVDLILANGQSIGFDYLVQDGDRIAVYPRFRTLDVAQLSLVRPSPLEQYRFILDVHLGRLATYLRMLGFDTLYRNDYADEELAGIASREKRILLTRDRGLLKRSMVKYGYCLRTTNPRRQIAEVLHRFDLFKAIEPLQRCLSCNALLRSVEKSVILNHLPPQTTQFYDEFRHCTGCDRIYWKGSHYERMQQFIGRVLNER